jgi:cytidylate kinase
MLQNNNYMKLLGISGTNGAGKDSIGEFLASHHNWLFVSVTEILRDELRRRDMPIEREHLRSLSAEWRKQYGLGTLIDKAVDIYNQHKKEYAGLVVSSLRNPGEADEVHRLGGRVIWVDADAKTRYQRITSRARGTEDKKSFDEFLTEEQAEMQHSGHEATLSMEGVKAKADIFIENNGDDLANFHMQIEKNLGL